MRSTKSRRPVSHGLLCKIVHELPFVCSNQFEVTLFTACFSKAFFGALRIGELVSPSKSVVKGLLGSDVVLANDSIRVRIRRSKTDVFGRGEWIPLSKVDSVACPVGAVAAYVQAKGSCFFGACRRYAHYQVSIHYSF